MKSKQSLKQSGGKMLVKFNARGKGGAAGAINYLTGDFGTVDGRMPNKAEQELGIGKRSVKPVVLRGDVKQTAQLIDGLSFSRNYTSGTLSFKEKNIPVHQKEKIMDDFQKNLLAGLDADQYDILWVEHRDKDRLELNFLIPNVELGTGKRLQPYYDKFDRARVNAWQQITNDENDYSDPHDPQHKRFSVTAHDLPKDKKQAVKIITDALVNQVDRGEVRSRDDVISRLKECGLEIARETKSSISIKDPDGGKKNIRLKGALYERDFKFSEKTDETVERTNRAYQEQREQRLSAARKTLEKTYSGKCEYNENRYPRTEQAKPESNRDSNIQSFASILDRNDNRRSIDSSRAVHTTEIKHPTILKVVKNNVGHQSRISTCFKAIVEAVRTAVQRSNRASQCTSGADNFAHRNKIKQFQQRQLKQVKRNTNTRTTEFTM
jgi:hypothetical protein